jgi:hypothetical protein
LLRDRATSSAVMPALVAVPARERAGCPVAGIHVFRNSA